MFDSLLSLDQKLLLSLSQLIPHKYTLVVKIISESIVIFGALMLVGLWLYGVKQGNNTYKIIALKIFFTTILTFFIYSIINLGLPQWRIGGMELTGANAIIPHPTDNSFPSGHALFSAALIVGIWRFFRKKTLLIYTLILTIATGSFRVLGGIHYPGDIIGGWIFGGLSAWILSYVAGSRAFQEIFFPLLFRIASLFRL